MGIYDRKQFGLTKLALAGGIYIIKSLSFLLMQIILSFPIVWVWEQRNSQFQDQTVFTLF